MKVINVAIDGPAGAGKSTISRAASAELGYIYIDTGAMYRTVALYTIRQKVDSKCEADVVALLDEICVDIKHIGDEQHVFLNGEDVSALIRTPEVSVAASNVAVIPKVRLKLVELQRELAAKNNVIMDGRDIGTYVLPDANVKIFLTADVEQRAKRRFDELCEKGTKCDFEEVLRDMKYRDKNDSEREFAPLKPSEESVILDTTHLSLSESIKLVIDTIKNKVN